jgi:flavodoxin
MRATVVYESMYTNTHKIAEQIAAGLGRMVDTTVVAVPEGDAAIDGTELLVVGGPTHVHGMSHASTRRAAIEDAEKPGKDLTVDPAATGPGVRDWLATLPTIEIYAAAFDTRMEGKAWLTGRASKPIAKRLHYSGCTMLVEPESFIVDKHNELEPGELERARQWGEQLATTLAALPRLTPYESTSAAPAGSDVSDA